MGKGKAWLAIALLAALAVSLTGCSKQKYADGTYYAQAQEFAPSGWKDVLELTIEDGEITRISWDAIYKDESIPIRKKQYSKSGLYGMLAAGAVGEWYDQAIAAEQYALVNGIEGLNLDEGGYTDAISGCTIHVNAFEELVRQCLAQAER